MRELIPFVETLVDLAGGYERATEWAASLQIHGLETFRRIGLTTDTRLVAERQAREAGLTDDSGHADAVRCAQLVILLDLLAAIPPPRRPEPRSEPLVFTVPPEAAQLITPGERLTILVSDVIRSARRSLHIGGPFWNAEGLQLLRPVLEPALTVRSVTCEFYVHRSGQENRDELLQSFVRGLGSSNRIKTWWYSGSRGSLMHAKFCVADGQVGYFGSANLTSLGLGQHIEVGVKLSQSQCQELLKLLSALIEAGLFVEAF